MLEILQTVSGSRSVSPKAVSILMILFTVSTNAMAQIMLKHGMSSVGAVTERGNGPLGVAVAVLFNPWVFSGLCVFVISMASHLAVLSRVELSFAYPFLSIAYIIVAAFAFFVFGEEVGVLRLCGYALICFGTTLVAFS